MPKTCETHFEERPYFPGDLNSLDKIEQKAGEASWSRHEIKNFINRLDVDTRIVTTLEEPDQAIGFYAVEHGDETLYICNLAVATSWRRRGVAMFALKAAIRFGRELNYKKLSLHVQEENLPAQLLYRKAGFQVVNIHRGHYDGQDGYQMEYMI